MLFKSLVSAALAATALAQPVQQHQHHQHAKKDQITHTVIVTAGAAAPSYAAAVEVSSAAGSAADSGAASAPASAAASSGASPVASGSSSSSSSSSSSGSGSGSFSGAAKAITYTPYADDGSCKDASTVKSELAKLSGFEVIRIYGVDCNQVPNVLAGLSSGQKIFAGIYNTDNISGDIETLASAVKNAGGWDIVDTVSIGNELVNGGQATVSQVGSYVKEARSALTSAGYSGSVVAVDTFIAVINNPGLCDYSDYMAVNAHPYFDGGVTAEESGKWVLEQLQRVSSACSGKKVFITETGWPTRGNSNGKAVPSQSNQEAALSSISETCGNDVTFFTAYNDLWKEDGSYGVEKYWGIYSS